MRVAALGGGMGTLSALFDLTSPENPNRDRYDVTVYQVGWRLGGKGASGRNLDPDGFGRIEEHGLHNLFGFYDNLFRLLRACYAELDRPEGHPLRTWRDGLSAESTAVFVERVGDRFIPWQLFNPTNDLEPGDGDDWLPLWDTLHLALGFLELNLWHVPDAPPTPERPTRLHPLLEPVRAALYVACRSFDVLRKTSPLLPVGSRRRRALRRGAERAAASALKMAQGIAWPLVRSRIETSNEARRGWVLFNFSSAVLIGLLEDGVLGKSLDALDEHDFREWILPRLHDDGGLTSNGALMKVMYESSFAYRDGDTSIPRGHTFPPKADYGAGSLLRGVIRSALTYKGAFGWKFTSGTGDVLFAPLYEVLKRRGVKFRFFHRVSEIGADALGTRVDRIRMARQVTLKREEYDPLVELDGVPCWPNVPRFEQLVEGEALRDSKIDLEQHQPTWKDAETFELVAGRDFDEVLLGISVGAFPWICRDLIEKNDRFGEMVRHLRTTRTEALQVWMDVPTHATGWKPKGRPITGFWYDEQSPLNVWADLTHLIAAERWGDAPPKHLSWFVSPMADEAPLENTKHGPVDTPSGVDAARAHAIAAKHAHDLMRDHVPRVLMPSLPNDGSTIRTEYVRANVAPSDRYVLTVAGSTKFRMSAHDPEGFANLYLAGDWTKNGLDSGAMESACLSGRLASSALSGWPKREDIPGADFL